MDLLLTLPSEDLQIPDISVNNKLSSKFPISCLIKLQDTFFDSMEKFLEIWWKSIEWAGLTDTILINSFFMLTNNCKEFLLFPILSPHCFNEFINSFIINLSLTSFEPKLVVLCGNYINIFFCFSFINKFFYYIR